MAPPGAPTAASGTTAARAAVRRDADRWRCSLPVAGRRPGSRPPRCARCCQPGVPPRRAARTVAPLAASFPFLRVFPLNSAAPVSILASGPPPAPPKPLTGGRIRGLRGGSFSISPQKASNRRRPSVLKSGSSVSPKQGSRVSTRMKTRPPRRGSRRGETSIGAQ